MYATSLRRDDGRDLPLEPDAVAGTLLATDFLLGRFDDDEGGTGGGGTSTTRSMASSKIVLTLFSEMVSTPPWKCLAIILFTMGMI